MSLLEEKLSFALLEQCTGSLSEASVLFHDASLLAPHMEWEWGGCMAK